jgi:hypothetical protein
MREEGNMARHAWWAVALALMVGTPSCGRSASPSATVTAFNELIATKGSVTFLSWNGKWIGFDGDCAITFLPGGAVELTRYSYAVMSYKGSYQIDANDIVTLKLSDFEGTWPAMVLEKDDKSLLLRPTDVKEAGKYDGRYWPFRVIEGSVSDARGPELAN